MADWIHCNSCFRQPGQSFGLKFFLTSCGHVFCDNCLSEGTKDKCKICGTRCTSTLLSGKISPEVDIFFSDPLSLMKKNYKQMVQVIEFQKNHRRRLYSYLKQMLSQQNVIMEKMKGYQKSSEQIQQLEREILLLRQENSYLKKAIAGGKGGSPSPSNSISSRLLPQSSQISSSQQNMMHISNQRISLRTPPQHGKMGIIPGTPSPITPGRRQSPQVFGLKLKEVKTPNPYDPETPRAHNTYSPMHTSPAHMKGYVR